MEIKAKLKKNKFIENTFWLLFSQFFYLGISFIVSIYAARLLGPEQIGIIDYSNNYITMLIVIASLGIDSIVIKDLVNKKDKTGDILGSAFLIKFIASSISLILFDLFIYLVARGNTILILIAFIQSFLLIFKLYSVFDLYYQSILESRKIVQVRCITTTLFSIIKMLILFYSPNLIIYVCFTVLEHLACLVLVYIAFKKTNIKLSVSFNTSKSLLQRGYHFILSDLLVMIYTRMDKIMLGAIKGTAQLGVYSVAALLSDLWTLLPNALISSARPKILEYKNIDQKLYEKSLKKLYAAIFYIGLIISLIVYFLSNQIITLLYGKEYIEASIPMIILSFSSIFAILGSARSIWLVSEDLQQYTKYYILMGAVLNLILNLILIVPFGMKGIAFSTLVSQIVVAIIGPAFIKKTRYSTVLMIEAILLKGVF